jgi:hypothetical protein
MNPIELSLSAAKAARKLYDWLVKSHLRERSEAAARRAPTASVIRGACVKLHWYEGPAALALQREGHGRIRDGYYETQVNVTPRGILMAMAMRGR